MQREFLRGALPWALYQQVRYGGAAALEEWQVGSDCLGGLIDQRGAVDEVDFVVAGGADKEGEVVGADHSGYRRHRCAGVPCHLKERAIGAGSGTGRVV